MYSAFIEDSSWEALVNDNLVSAHSLDSPNIYTDVIMSASAARETFRDLNMGLDTPMANRPEYLKLEVKDETPGSPRASMSPSMHGGESDS